VNDSSRGRTTEAPNEYVFKSTSCSLDEAPATKLLSRFAHLETLVLFETEVDNFMQTLLASRSSSSLSVSRAIFRRNSTVSLERGSVPSQPHLRLKLPLVRLEIADLPRESATGLCL
jgi:hypothetical protein